MPDDITPEDIYEENIPEEAGSEDNDFLPNRCPKCNSASFIREPDRGEFQFRYIWTCEACGYSESN